MVRLDFAALYLAVIARSVPVPEASSTLAERQFTIGNPWTGIWPPGPPDTPTIVFPGNGRGDAAPSTKIRKDIGLGGSGPSGLKARLAALQLEYEALVQRYGSSPPSHVAQRLETIAAELKHYGIAIVKSPDGTTTVITPGKAKRDLAIDEGRSADQSLDLVGLETTLEQLMQQYGPSPPHDIYILEEKIKSILKAYGITIIRSPDGTITTITPSTKRATAGYDLTALHSILTQAREQHDNAPPPLGDWLVMRDMAAVLQSYGVALAAAVPAPQARSAVADANAGFLQTLLARLQASYGTAEAPQDIFLVEQTIATLLWAQDIAVPGWSAPGGPIIPDKSVPGGPLVPDETIPGGPMAPSTKMKKRQKPTTRTTGTTASAAGLQAALARLGEAYGAPGAGSLSLPVFLVMQSAITMLQGQGQGLAVPGWPPVLGDGSTVIGPSD